jgi:hypothetical protein
MLLRHGGGDPRRWVGRSVRAAMRTIFEDEHRDYRESVRRLRPPAALPCRRQFNRGRETL